MPIIRGSIVTSSVDGETYQWMGGQWKKYDEKTGKASKIASRKVVIDLEVQALKTGLVDGESVYQDLMNFAIKQGYIKDRTEAAITFMRDTAQNMRGSKAGMRTSLFLQENVQPIRSMLPGQMICFYYDAKLKQTIPYWDSFPVDIILSSDDKYFTCLNLHYLPPLYRARMLDLFYHYLPRLSEGTQKERLDISWEKLVNHISTFKYFKPCIKRYLKSHVRSNIMMIPTFYWSVVAFLPLAAWQKSTESKVWQDSIKKFF